jgi:hypothetical protein
VWAELDAVGKFLPHQPNATAYLVGYTGSVGFQDGGPGLQTRKERMK